MNSTFRTAISGGWEWFSGMAYSLFDRKVDGAVTEGDHWCEKQAELHFKTKLSKKFHPTFWMDVGFESFLRWYETRYSQVSVADTKEISPTIEAVFGTVSYYPVENLKAELSFRTEYASLARKINFSPRLSFSYSWCDLVLSATAGRYTQLPNAKYLAQQPSLLSEACRQYNVGGLYKAAGRFYKAEFYYKKYDRLVLYTPAGLTSGGYGSSKGVDLYFEDRSLMRNLECNLSYSFNLSQRKYLEYTELTTPQYATRHNASLVLKYSLTKLRTIVALTERFASGRPYHNPVRSGLMNDETKPYNSLDLGFTFLATKKMIIHASATNVLCRKNEFGRIDGKPLLASSDHFFYLGVFITLGKKAAYDVSNF